MTGVQKNLDEAVAEIIALRNENSQIKLDFQTIKQNCKKLNDNYNIQVKLNTENAAKLAYMSDEINRLTDLLAQQQQNNTSTNANTSQNTTMGSTGQNSQSSNQQQPFSSTTNSGGMGTSHVIYNVPLNTANNSQNNATNNANVTSDATLQMQQNFNDTLRDLTQQFSLIISSIVNSQTKPNLYLKDIREFTLGTPAKKYFENLEEKAKLCNFTDDQIKKALGLKININLSDKYRVFNSINNHLDWNNFKQEFIREFSSKTAKIAALSRIKNLNRNDYKTTDEFLRAYTEIMESNTEGDNIVFRHTLIEKLHLNSSSLIAANILTKDCSTAEFLDHVRHIDNWNIGLMRRKQEHKIFKNEVRKIDNDKHSDQINNIGVPITDTGQTDP